MTEPIDSSEYCRLLERYLCQKNEGHLIRIVGPVFEQVCGWAAQGVPLAIARRGIDRYCERYYAKGPRRRPVRIEFCEADVLEAFDAWRRAVGIPASGTDGEAAGPPQRPTLPAHIERVIARLTARRAGGQGSPAFHARLDDAVRALDGMASGARTARGDERAAILERLRDLDRGLIAAAKDDLDAARLEALRDEAAAELAPFAARLPDTARATATDIAFERLLRDAAALPQVLFE